MLLDDRIAAHPSLRRNFRLSGDFDALTRRREFQSVIHASKILALEASERERREAMTASILQRDQAAIAFAVDNYGFVQDRDSGQRVLGEIAAPARYVPTVADKHLRFLHGRILFFRCSSAKIDRGQIRESSISTRFTCAPIPRLSSEGW